MNKRCLTLTEEQYRECVKLLRTGFFLDGVHVKPNDRISTIVVLQACLGLRLSDTLSLSLSSFVRDGDRYRLDIVEQKTQKVRRFSVPMQVYSFIQDYAIRNKIGIDAKLFAITERQCQRHLNKVFTKMGLPVRNYGSHSFRKYFATSVYVNNNYDIRLVQQLLQHSSPAITPVYIGISQKTIEDALEKTAGNLI
jgi:integrase